MFAAYSCVARVEASDGSRGDALNARDYNAVSRSIAKFLKAQADRLRRQCTVSTIKIGTALLEAKRHLTHGAFTGWAESPSSDRTGQYASRKSGLRQKRSRCAFAAIPQMIIQSCYARCIHRSRYRTAPHHRDNAFDRRFYASLVAETDGVFSLGRRSATAYSRAESNAPTGKQFTKWLNHRP
jgi:hypothetical protein